MTRMVVEKAEDEEKLKPLTTEGIQQLERGISIELYRWTGLRMAVENGWGGPHSLTIARNIVSDILSFFTQSRISDIHEMKCSLETLLIDGLDSLCTEANDGSVEQVADVLSTMYQNCCRGNYDCIRESERKLSQSHPNMLSTPYQQATVNASSNDDDIDENQETDSINSKRCSSSSLPDYEDDDGFLPGNYKKRKTRRRRNM